MEALHALAAAQHGLLTRHQLLAAGIPRGTFDQWTRKGRLRRVRSGVFALPGSVPSDLQSLLAAVLAAGEAASHPIGRLLGCGIYEANRPWSFRSPATGGRDFPA